MLPLSDNNGNTFAQMVSFDINHRDVSAQKTRFTISHHIKKFVSFLQQVVHIVIRLLNNSFRLQSPTADAVTVEEYNDMRVAGISNWFILLNGLYHISLFWVFIVYQAWMGVVDVTLVWVISLAVWYANYRGYFFTGKVLIAVGFFVVTMVFICVIHHKVPGSQYLLLILLFAIFWISGDSLRDKILLGISIAIFTGSIILVEIYEPVLHIGNNNAFPEPVMAYFRFSVPFTIIYSTILIMAVLRVHLRRNWQKLNEEIENSEKLLLNILPESVASRLKANEEYIADYFPNATVLFADLCGFTRLAADMKPQEVVAMLNTIFTHFDSIARKHGVEKIKTIGDAYMLVGGVPDQCPDHIARVARAALEIRATLPTLFFDKLIGVTARIGIHTGEVVAGIIGTSKFSYDMWGDTVNTASRMESHGEPGKIHCSDDVYLALQENFWFEPCESQHIKGKGTMQTWFLVGAKQPYHNQILL